MITLEKLKLYNNYKGNIDYFGHAPSRDRKIIGDDDFYIIDSLIQDLNLVLKQLTSNEYSQKVEERVIKLCDDDKTIEFLKEIALTK
jgi:hypothetical protein